MRTTPFWGPSIRVRFRKTPACLALAAFTCGAFAQTPDALGRNYRKNPTPQNRSVLVRFAAAHPRDAEGAQALFALGAVDFERRVFPEAIASLQSAEKRLPKLADYTAYLIASSNAEINNPSEVVKRVETVWKHAPASPLLAKSVLLGAKADVDLQKPKDGIELLRKHSSAIPQPQGDLLLASSSEAMGDAIGSVAYYQRVYYQYPNSPEAAQAETALARLKSTLGDSFPPAMPQTMLDRALRLLNGGDPWRAKRELESLQPQLGGGDREIAMVRVGVASYFAKDNDGALKYLKPLNVSSPEADAERLYYIFAAARRLNRENDASDALDKLNKLHPKSKWRLQALVSAANQFLVRNSVEQSDPLYRACYESFPNEPEAAGCHWKVAWNAYLHRTPDGVTLLRAHLTSYPGSEKAAAALYFLARDAEKAKRIGDARAYYSEIVDRFPGFFHAVLAREKLRENTIARAQPSDDITDFLTKIPFPPRNPRQSFDATAETRVRIERARLLAGAGLDDWAENELRFGAKYDAQPHILAMELAQMADRRGSPDQGIRYIKSFASGYLNIPLDAAPEKFWRLAFPMPYRSALEMNSKLRSLDPYMVAALIRQESEFNPQALSRAKAYGLTQVLPSTGREVSRKLGVRKFTAKMLYQPDVNLKLGTYYLKMLLDQLGGEWETTLASYNAGKSRVVNWLSWAKYEEPAEFIESIPFQETRNYVQIVMRNADLYRRLYGPKPAAVTSTDGLNSKRISPGGAAN